MKLKLLSTATLTAVLLAVRAAAAAPELFVFDNGVGRGTWAPEQQARTLKELGFAGVSYNYTNPQDLAAWQKAFKKEGLKIYALYLYTYLDAAEPFDPTFREAIKLLKGTDTVVWVTVRAPNRKGDQDEQAVKIVREIADLAAAQGVRVALYGHFDFYVENAADSARIVKLADRPNLGATINLCHEFLTGKADDLDQTLAQVAPLATMASINGVDVAGTNYIVRLDQGDFDVTAYVQRLLAAGYHGPIGLQCYSVKGDLMENLAANRATWRRMVGQLAERSPGAPPQNTLSSKEAAQGWQLLFDGTTTTHWRGFQQAEFPDRGWTVEDGCLKCLGRQGGDLVTRTAYTNFEFAWEWRLSFQGNSGVKYFVDESRSNQRGAIAHEYQTIDDKNFAAEPLNEKKFTGAWYDVMPAKSARPKPVGEWNQSRLVVRGNQVEHWLNGRRVLTYRTDSARAAAGIANSKFKHVPGYADKIVTPILLQDHDTVVWYRNLKIRVLP
jgi:sugar phosphate isomerase/epimerase